jgi:O-glycosyl hydrolase
VHPTAPKKSAGEDFVFIILNRADSNVTYTIEVGTQQAEVHIPAHSIQTLVIDAALFDL